MVGSIVSMNGERNCQMSNLTDRLAALDRRATELRDFL